MHVYFDNNATVQPSQNVIEAMMEVLQRPLNASSIHANGREARRIIEKTREKLRNTLSIPQEYRIIFTSSGTEANNTVIESARTEGYQIYASAIEHLSVMAMKPKYLLPVNQDGELCLDSLSKICQNNETSKAILSVMLANNETGVIQPITEVKKITDEQAILLHVDAVQGPGKINFKIDELGADVVTISGHKFGGPQGIGCIIYNTNTFKIIPLVMGGGQEYGLRSGTENIAAIHGLGIACNELENRTAKMHNEIKVIRDFIEKELITACPDAVIFGKNAQNRLPNTTSIMMSGVKSEVQVAYFDANGFAVSAGSACSASRVENPYVQTAMGYSYDEGSCALRISLGIDNTFEEANRFINKWVELYKRHTQEK